MYCPTDGGFLSTEKTYFFTSKKLPLVIVSPQFRRDCSNLNITLSKSFTTVAWCHPRANKITHFTS